MKNRIFKLIKKLNKTRFIKREGLTINIAEKVQKILYGLTYKSLVITNDKNILTYLKKYEFISQQYYINYYILTIN